MFYISKPNFFRMMIILKLINFFLEKIDYLFWPLPTVLTYHSISDGKTTISVLTGHFRRQMAFLKESETSVISIRDFLDFKAGKLKLKGRTILITFDDAFRDVFLNALPILKEFNFPAVIFINPSLLGKKAEFATREEDKKREICSLSDLRLLAENGVAIANHGYSHRQLSGLSESEVVAEYENARDWIKNNFFTNSYPDVFVFPKGAKNEQVKSYLRNNGAKILDDRIDIYSDTSPLGFILKLSRSYFWLRKKMFLLNSFYGGVF